MFPLWFARLYSHLYGFCHDYLRFNPKGLGFVLRNLRSFAVLEVDGLKVVMHPAIGTSYARLLGGKWNEVETHLFIRRVAPVLGPSVFVDIGANIGEMVIDFARLPSFKHLVAYEPDPVCANIIRANAALNNHSNITTVTAGVSAKASKAYLLGGGTPQASLSATRKLGAVPTSIVTLDGEAQHQPALRAKAQAVVLIDVEGHELEVMKGSLAFIEKRQPLIIFEFNHISRKSFSLEQVRGLLGKGYVIRRLNRKGLLDDNLADTWNCVAVPRKLAPLLAKALRAA